MSLAEIVIRGLVADHNVACNACGARFRRSGLRVLRREHDVWQISARCPNCSSVSLLVVRLDRSGVVSDIELSGDERDRFADAPPVTVDDVLDMAGFLATFDGDFKALFAARASAPDDDVPEAEPRD